MLNILYTGSVSACFELENNFPYYAAEEYKVTLNGKELFSANTNVFSLYDLKPNTDYTLEVTGHGVLNFTTAKETCAVNIKDFGAIGDGVHDDTANIQTAINCLPKGGRIHFPKGTYSTAPLCLKSHMIIDLAEDAILLGNTDPARYPVIPGAIVDRYMGG